MTGYLAIFAFDPVNRSSDLVLLDAAHIDAEPVAVIRMAPARPSRPARNLDSEGLSILRGL